MGRATYNKHSKIWRSSQLSMNTRIRIFIAVLLYGCETWRMTKKMKGN